MSILKPQHSFTPTIITIENTDSIEELLKEFYKINEIHLTDFIRCENEFKEYEFKYLITELNLLATSLSDLMTFAYNISTMEKSILLKESVRETILKFNNNFKKKIINLQIL